MENMAKSLKAQKMAEIEVRNKNAASYGEGYADGFFEGWDKAIKSVLTLADKHSYGKKVEEAELKPAIRFLHQSQQKLLDKIVEECDEVIEAFNDGESKERIAEEVADVQEACETYLAKLGFSADGRKQVRLQVIDKNGKRGYYNPKDGSYGD